MCIYILSVKEKKMCIYVYPFIPVKCVYILIYLNTQDINVCIYAKLHTICIIMTQLRVHT